PPTPHPFPYTTLFRSGVGIVSRASLGCGGAIIADRCCEGGLFGSIELLETCALFLPVARLGLLNGQQDRERQATLSSRRVRLRRDRKSTRLNSSHVKI